MRSIWVPPFLVAVILVLPFLGLGEPTRRVPGSSDGLAAHRESLARALARDPNVLFVLPPGDGSSIALAQAVGAMVQDLRGEAAEGRVVRYDALAPHDLASHHLVAIGTARSHPLIQDALKRIRAWFGPRTLRILDDEGRVGQPGGRFGPAANQANLTLRLANPFEPDLGLVVFTAFREEVLVDFLWSLGCDEDYVLRIGDRWVRWGRFDSASAAVFSPVPGTEINLVPRGARSDYEDRIVRTEVPPYNIAYPKQDYTQEEIQTRFRPRAPRILGLTRELGLSRKPPLLGVWVYPDRQTKGEMTGNLEYTHPVEAAHQIHTVLDESFDSGDVVSEFEIAVRDLFAEIRIRSIREGLAVAFAGSWRGEPLEAWEARLRQAGQLVGLADLLDDSSYRAHSPYFAVPSAASFCRYVLDRWDLDRLRLLGAAPPDAADPVGRVFENPLGQIEAAWYDSVRERTEDRMRDLEVAARQRRERATSNTAIHRGVRIDHTWRLESGYASREAAAEIARIRDETGAEWISIHPKTRFAEPGRPRLAGFPPPTNALANGYPDGALEACLGAARKLGLHVFLSPSVTTFGWGEGGIEFTDPTDWRVFFDEYRRFLLHYAALAERFEVDLLGLGEGLGPAVEARRAEWEALVGAVAGVFHGARTYCTGSLEELAALPFHDRLDLLAARVTIETPRPGSGFEVALAYRIAEIDRQAGAITGKTGKRILLAPLRLREAAGSVEAVAAPPLPWDSVEARALERILEGCWKAPWSAGVYAWRAFPDARLDHRSTWGIPPLGASGRAVLRRAYESKEGESR